MAAAAGGLLLLAGPAAAGEAARGQAKAVACATCHGAGGVSETAETPSLAGQPAYYLTIQLVLFRDRQRRSPVMTPVAQGLSDADIADLAAFYAAQPPEEPGPPADPALAEAGRRIAAANHCGACHLPDYSGREQMPRLAGQREDYLLKAMRDYKAGTRPGLDGVMTEVLYALSDADLAALAHHLAHRP